MVNSTWKRRIKPKGENDGSGICGKTREREGTEQESEDSDEKAGRRADDEVVSAYEHILAGAPRTSATNRSFLPPTLQSHEMCGSLQPCQLVQKILGCTSIDGNRLSRGILPGLLYLGPS